MGRERRIWCALLTCILCCCTKTYEDKEQDIEILFDWDTIQTRTDIQASAASQTRATDPDEDLISDLSLMIFGQDGILEDYIWLSKEDVSRTEELKVRSTLLRDKTYSIYACANIGYQLRADNIDELKELRCHLAYPDEYKEGIPMAGHIKDCRIGTESRQIVLQLERLMSKISLRIDRGGLSDGVSMNVAYAKIGNCPKVSYLFQSNRVKEHDECFVTGFSRRDLECTVLNSNSESGLSQELSMYMLENMQGTFSDIGIIDDDAKVFDDGSSRSRTCSYIEIGLDYISPAQYSKDKPLIYRFYLGDGRNSLDVERNCHYHITIIPEDDGLNCNSWRVDKSGLCEREDQAYFKMSPSGFIQATVGEVIHVRCDFYPLEAPFDIGMEELEFDKGRGIYDYTIDPDGKGVRISLKAPGTGILYMSAGSPINRSETLIVEVNNIKNKIS